MTQISPLTSAETWAAARRDYLGGASAPVVSERYGLSERTLRRRAAAEGWRRADVETPAQGAQPYWNRPPPSKAQAVADFPELAEVDQARGQDDFYLLFDPQPRELRRFAFKRAAEAAAADQPHQATAWMRLAQLVDRCGDRIDREARPFQDIDYLRAAYLRRLGDEQAERTDAIADDKG